MRLRLLLMIAVGLSVSTLPGMALADDLVTLTSGSTVISLVVPESIDLYDDYSPSDFAGVLTGGAVTIDGTTTALIGASFWTTNPFAGGLSINDASGDFVVDQLADQLFTETIDISTGNILSVSFDLGDFSGTGNYFGSDRNWSVDPFPTATYNDNFDIDITTYVSPPAATPEPSSLSLFASGLLGLAGIARRKSA